MLLSLVQSHVPNDVSISHCATLLKVPLYSRFTLGARSLTLGPGGTLNIQTVTLLINKIEVVTDRGNNVNEPLKCYIKYDVLDVNLCLFLFS